MRGRVSFLEDTRSGGTCVVFFPVYISRAERKLKGAFCVINIHVIKFDHQGNLNITYNSRRSGSEVRDNGFNRN